MKQKELMEEVTKLGRVKLDVLRRIKLGKLRPQDAHGFAFPLATKILLKKFPASDIEKVLLLNMLSEPVAGHCHIALVDRLGSKRAITLLDTVEKRAISLLDHMLSPMLPPAQPVVRYHAELHAAGSAELAARHRTVVHEVLSKLVSHSVPWRMALTDSTAAVRFLHSIKPYRSEAQHAELALCLNAVHSSL